MKYLVLLLVLVSGYASAGYKGLDNAEVAKTTNSQNELKQFYDYRLSLLEEVKTPVCKGRSLMRFTHTNGIEEVGCWWIIGELMFGFTNSRGVMKFNTDLVLVNDNYVEDTRHPKEGF